MDPTEVKQLLRRHKTLTIKQAAEIIGMHPNFLYLRMGTEDGPPAKKFGRVWRLPTWEFLQWARPEAR